MNTEKYIPIIVTLAVILIIAAAIIIAALAIRSKLRQASRQFFGTDSLIEGYRKQKRTVSETPRSVKAMTRVLLPVISKDFPSFNYDEFKAKAELAVTNYVSALASLDSRKIPSDCKQLKEQAQAEIEAINANGYTEVIADFKLHQTEICDYRRQNGLCCVYFCSSAEYMRYTTAQNGKIIKGDNEFKKQTTFTTCLAYVQDVERVGENLKGLGLNCPNCGAPVKSLNGAYCEYCGTGVEPININAWHIISVRDDGQ